MADILKNLHGFSTGLKLCDLYLISISDMYLVAKDQQNFDLILLYFVYNVINQISQICHCGPVCDVL